MLNDGDPVEALRQGEWIPGVVRGGEPDDERGFVILVDLDRPDRSGDQEIWTDYLKIRPRALPCGCQKDGSEICQEHWRPSAIAAE